jgi:hypothetical protein
MLLSTVLKKFRASRRTRRQMTALRDFNNVNGCAHRPRQRQHPRAERNRVAWESVENEYPHVAVAVQDCCTLSSAKHVWRACLPRSYEKRRRGPTTSIATGACNGDGRHPQRLSRLRSYPTAILPRAVREALRILSKGQSTPWSPWRRNYC